MALADNSKTNATNSNYGATLGVYKCAFTGVETNHTDSDSDFSKMLSALGQWTTVLAWQTPASGAAYVITEGGIDLTACTTATPGTIIPAEGGWASNNCVITKHLTLA
jgi:hypothetical protein